MKYIEYEDNSWIKWITIESVEQFKSVNPSEIMIADMDIPLIAEIIRANEVEPFLNISPLNITHNGIGNSLFGKLILCNYLETFYDRT